MDIPTLYARDTAICSLVIPAKKLMALNYLYTTDEKERVMEELTNLDIVTRYLYPIDNAVEFVVELYSAAYVPSSQVMIFPIVGYETYNLLRSWEKA